MNSRCREDEDEDPYGAISVLVFRRRRLLVMKTVRTFSAGDNKNCSVLMFLVLGGKTLLA